MTDKIQSPAVFSAKQAFKKSLEMKSFMNEKIAGGQLQSQKNMEIQQAKLEAQLKAQEDKNSKEQKLAQKAEKANKEKVTESLTKSLKSGI